MITDENKEKHLRIHEEIKTWNFSQGPGSKKFTKDLLKIITICELINTEIITLFKLSC